MKYKALFPKGYNKRYNCSVEDREKFLLERKQEEYTKEMKEGFTPFPIENIVLKILSTNDEIYTWLLLHSNYDNENKFYFISGKDFTFKKIGEDIGKVRQTVSTGLKKLLSENNLIKEPFLYYDKENDKYIMPILEKTILVSDKVLEQLLLLCKERNRTGLIAIYFLLKSKNTECEFALSYSELIKSLGHSLGNKQIYDRYKEIMNVLQDTGLVYFDSSNVARENNGRYSKTIIIKRVE